MFAFYRTPKAFFQSDEYKDLSAEAKILYGILLDRVSLSAMNEWKDEAGRVFIYCTLESIQEIMELILDTVCSKRKTIRIAGDDKPLEVVKSRFMKLDYSHISYVLSCLKENSTQVRNIKQYLLAALYNAPLTISNYYQAMYNNDHANGLV